MCTYIPGRRVTQEGHRKILLLTQSIEQGIVQLELTSLRSRDEVAHLPHQLYMTQLPMSSQRLPVTATVVHHGMSGGSVCMHPKGKGTDDLLLPQARHRGHRQYNSSSSKKR